MANDVVDTVMGEILKGCKRKARRDVQKELTTAKAEAKKAKEKLPKLEKEIVTLKGQIKKLKKDLRDADSKMRTREKRVADAASKVLKMQQGLEKLRNKTVGSFMKSGETYWQTARRQTEALRQLRKEFGTVRTPKKKPVRRRRRYGMR